MEAMMLASYVLRTQKNYREIDIERIASSGSSALGDISRLAGTVAAIAFFAVVLKLSA